MDKLSKHFIETNYSSIEDGCIYLVWLKEKRYKICNATIHFGRLLLVDDSNYGEGEEISKNEIEELYKIVRS